MDSGDFKSSTTTPNIPVRSINFNDVDSQKESNGKQEREKTQQTSNESQPTSIKSSLKRSRSVSEELAQLAPTKVVSMWREFADFAFQGNVIDLSIGLIMGMLDKIKLSFFIFSPKKK
jgi:hypothetical protein